MVAGERGQRVAVDQGAVEVEERADRGPCGPGLDVGEQLLLGPAPASGPGTAHGATPTASRRVAASSSSITAHPARRRRAAWAAHSCAPRGPAPRGPGRRGRGCAASRSAVANSSRESDSGPCSRPCSSICWPDAAALVEELLLDDRRARGRGRPAARRRRAARRRTSAAPGGPRASGAPAQHLAAVGGPPSPGPAARSSAASCAAVGLALGEEELELEQVAQPHRLVPAVAPGSRSSTSSAIARSTKWWIALLR